MKICVKVRLLGRRILRRLGLLKTRQRANPMWVEIAVAYAKKDSFAIAQLAHNMLQKHLDEGGSLEELS